MHDMLMEWDGTEFVIYVYLHCGRNMSGERNSPQVS